MNAMDLALAIGVSGFSAIMLATSVYSCMKTKMSKLLPICLAFLLFLIKGLYFISESVTRDSLDISIRIALGIDFAIILLIYIAAAKR